MKEGLNVKLELTDPLFQRHAKDLHELLPVSIICKILASHIKISIDPSQGLAKKVTREPVYTSQCQV